MNIRFLLQVFGVLALFFHSMEAKAKSVKGEYMSLEMPASKNYHQVWHNYDPQSGIMTIDFLPRGQTVENWRDTLSMFVSYHNLHGSPKFFARQLFKLIKTECNSPLVEILETGRRNGYPYSLIRFGCSKPNQSGKPDWNLAITYKGLDSFYAVMRSWKQKPSDAAVAEWRNILKTTHVCDTRRRNRPCRKNSSIFVAPRY